MTGRNAFRPHRSSGAQRIRQRLTLGYSLVAALLVAAPRAQASDSAVSQQDSAAIAGSAQAPIAVEELRAWVEFNQRAIGDLDSVVAALQAMAVSRQLSWEAEQRGIDRRPGVRLELEIAEAREARKALRRWVEASIEVSDAEAEAKYQQIKDTYTLPRRVRLRNLFLRFPPDAGEADREQVRARMATLIERLRAGEDFATLAAAESESQTRLQGGLLGNVPQGHFRPEVDAVVMALQPGELSEVVETAEGVTVFTCDRLLEARVRTAEDLRGIARDLLVNQRYRRGWAELQEHLATTAATLHWPVIEGEGAASAVAVDFVGGTVTRAELEAVVSRRDAAVVLRDLPRPRIQRQLETYLGHRMALREAQCLGLLRGAEDETRRRLQRQQILTTRMLVDLVEEQLEPVTEAEIERVFETNPSEFVRAPHFRLGVIALPLDPTDPRPSYDAAYRLVARIDGGELSFDAAARRFSTHPTATSGGDSGPVSRWELPRRFGIDVLRAVLRLEVGERADVVEGEGRLWIVELRGFEPERPLTLDEARRRAENLVGRARVAEIEETVLAERLAALDLEIDRSALAALVDPGLAPDRLAPDTLDSDTDPDTLDSDGSGHDIEPAATDAEDPTASPGNRK